jgi:hypothetical protein
MKLKEWLKSRRAERAACRAKVRKSAWSRNKASARASGDYKVIPANPLDGGKTLD